MDTENFDTSKYIALPIGGKNGGGKCIIIDKADEHLFAGKSISMQGPSNNLRPTISIKVKRVPVYNVIMGNPPVECMTVDHIDNNVLNNTRENLRWATTQQQNMNRRKSTTRPFSSKYKGVGFRANRNKWRADICIDSKSKTLGHFTTERDAAIAYNVAATAYFGEFAKLNKVDDE